MIYVLGSGGKLTKQKPACRASHCRSEKRREEDRMPDFKRFSGFFHPDMCDDQDTRPTKIQRTEASEETQVDKSSGVTTASRSENAALKGVQPFGASSASDFLSNVSRFKIIESTLRGM